MRPLESGYANWSARDRSGSFGFRKPGHTKARMDVSVVKLATLRIPDDAGCDGCHVGLWKTREPWKTELPFRLFRTAHMPRSYIRARLLVLVICLAGCGLAQQDKQDQNEETLQQSIRQHQYDLANEGETFLLNEARHSSFFLLGELHGENEIPALLRDLWPQMWQDGYRHIAAELSPWAAHQLEFVPADRQPKLATLWSKQEALSVRSPGASQPVLWGCDMDEMQPQLLILELAQANPANPNLQRMVEITKSGYQRSMAPALLELMRGAGDIQDHPVNDVSLAGNIRETLQIESDRLNKETKLPAQVRRESLMKDLFLQHYWKSVSPESGDKVMLRFGRNHLHRGYDERGISTLGNFVAEFAFSQHKTVFNLATFGAGGKASLAGETWDADERGDDPGFAFLASLARYSATIIDLRPLRDVLHRIPNENRSPLQKRLVYWADSYDAVLCYKNVTPLKQ